MIIVDSQVEKLTHYLYLIAILYYPTIFVEQHIVLETKAFAKLEKRLNFVRLIKIGQFVFVQSQLEMNRIGFMVLSKVLNDTFFLSQLLQVVFEFSSPSRDRQFNDIYSTVSYIYLEFSFDLISLALSINISSEVFIISIHWSERLTIQSSQNVINYLSRIMIGNE